MKKRHFLKYIHEGEYAAEVDVELIDEAGEWSPYLSIEDAEKLDLVRTALNSGDLKLASLHSRVFRMTPVAV
jgi:hypothetical protein